MENIFTQKGSNRTIQRIERLTAETTPEWGKMNVGQMLAHCNVTYEMVYEEKHPKPGMLKKFMLKLFVKNAVVNEKPYPKNGRTAPEFIIDGDRDFEAEKSRLIDHIRKTAQLGEDHFDGKESHSFGKLNKVEWNNLFSKHLDHHLRQFGV